jgi:hypothetical protein
LDGSAETLKEYVIGVDVFGKPDGYDPQSDASVRVQIGRLRRKLEEYYQDEGMSDPLLLQIPKRHFTISFEPRAESDLLPKDVISPARVRRMPALTPALLAATILLAALSLFLLIRMPAGRPAPLAPELREVWAPFLAGSRPVLISLGTLQFYRYSRNGSHGTVRQPDLDGLPNPERELRLRELQDMLHSSEPLRPYLIYTGVGQATAAFLFARQFDRMNVPVDLVRSNALSWDEISRENVIFLGSAKLNSQLREIPVAPAFRVDGDDILNLRPRPGEAASYGPDCSLISLYPGLHGAQEIMVVESGSSTGVWAAAQFLTDAVYAREMLAHLRQPDGRLPPHYQVVLRSQIAADVPIRISYVTHRRL